MGSHGNPYIIVTMLSSYLRHLPLKLPKRKGGPDHQFNEEVGLDYYQTQKIGRESINLAKGLLPYNFQQDVLKALQIIHRQISDHEMPPQNRQA